MSLFGSSILCLLETRCPAAISGFIITVVVDAFNRQFRWAWSHVSKECGKAITPFFIHTNAPSAVIFKHITSWIKTSGFDMHPNSIFATNGSTMFFSRTVRIFSKFFEPKTPTTFAITGCQLFGCYSFLIFAVAAADPACTPIFGILNTPQNNESSKSLARKVCNTSPHMGGF